MKPTAAEKKLLTLIDQHSVSSC